MPVNVGRLKNYEVGKQIGSGKFSVVFRARDVDGRNVALKKIHIFDMMDAKSRNKCLREVHMLQTISQHDNLIAYLDAFIEDNELMIVFEWAENGDLRRLLRKAAAPFEERQVWSYFLQVSGAIAHMHEQRMMHRDIKPANIFISANNVLKLGDLGLGRVFNTDSIEAFSKVGTPLYMSPEVLHGQGYDFKSDVWSLGCLLYEFATLKSPFEAPNQTLYDIFKKINNGDYPPLPDVFSQELRSLVSRMLHNDPKRRPTAAEAYNYAQMACEAFHDRPSGMTLMVGITDRCKMLDYEAAVCRPFNFPLLTPSFFTSNDAYVGIKFRYFRSLVQWLLSLNGVTVSASSNGGAIVAGQHIDDEDAAAASCVLLEQCKTIGVPLGGGLSPVRIRSGYGEAVLSLLDALLEHTIAHQGVVLLPPVHSTEDDIVEEGAETDDEDAVGWASAHGSDSESEKLDEVMADTTVWTGQAKFEQETADMWAVGAGPEEMEGWRGRMDRHTAMLKAHVDTGKWVAPRLERTRAAMAEGLDAIRARERLLNQAAEPRRDLLQRCMTGLEEAAARQATATQALALVQREHDVVSEEVERSREALEQKQAQLQDRSPLDKLQRSIRHLRREMEGLELKMGVAQHARWGDRKSVV